MGAIAKLLEGGGLVAPKFGGIISMDDITIQNLDSVMMERDILKMKLEILFDAVNRSHDRVAINREYEARLKEESND